MTTSKTVVDNSQDENAKKTVGHQIESSEFECIGGDILDTLPVAFHFHARAGWGRPHAIRRQDRVRTRLRLWKFSGVHSSD